MLGTGEYTTGWVGKASDSDKSTGVVALVMLDLKRRNTINDLAAMPAALGGRMGTTGIGMMGNAMMPYARAMMPNSGWLAAGPARRRGP